MTDFVGGNGNDTFTGGDGADTASGGGGSDTLNGGGGDDTLYSASPSPNPYPWAPPVLDTGTEVDTLNGGEGNDKIFAGYGDNVDGGTNGVFGDWLYISFLGSSSGVTVDFRLATNTVGGGTITGIEVTDWIQGSDFDDDITASGRTTHTPPTFGPRAGENNVIFGMGGNDRLIAGHFTQFIWGGDGNDFIDGRISEQLNSIYGEGGDDVLYGNNSPQYGWIYGGDGNDTLIGGTGPKSFDGGNGNDRIVLGSGVNDTSVNGGAGTDTLVLTSTVTSLALLSGIEAIEFQGSTLTLSGSQFTDGLAFDTVLSGTGNLIVNMTADVYFFSTQYSLAAGSTIGITVNGTAGDDYIKAGSTPNFLYGGDGQDFIRGGNAVDTIDGGAARDKITGLGGADILTGGAGGDLFRYLFSTDTGLGAAADRITDFLSGTDQIDLRAFDADPVAAGRQAFTFVGSAAFVADGTAQINTKVSGADLLVQFDTNGDGAADMQIILVGNGATTLTGGDFLL